MPDYLALGDRLASVARLLELVLEGTAARLLHDDAELCLLHESVDVPNDVWMVEHLEQADLTR